MNASNKILFLYSVFSLAAAYFFYNSFIANSGIIILFSLMFFLALKNVEYALYILAFTLPFETIFHGWGFGKYSMNAYPAICILVYYVIKNKNKKLLPSFSYFLLLIIFLGFFSSFWSPSFTKALNSVFTHFGLFATFYIYFCVVRNDTIFINVLKYFILGVFSLTVLLLIQYNPVLFVLDLGSGRMELSVLGGGEVSQYEVAHYSLSAYLSCLILIQSTKIKRKYLLYLLTLFFGVSILLSLSRAYTLALILTSVLYFTFTKGFVKKIKGFLYIAFLMLFIFLVVSILNFEGMNTRFLDTFSAVENNNMAAVSSGRSDIWDAALEIYKMNPILGSGFSSFGTVYDEYVGKAKGAHNSFLQYLIEVGIIGLLLFIMMLLLCFFKILTFKKYKNICLGIFVFLLIEAFFNGFFRSKGIWLLLGILFSVNSNISNKVTYQND